MNNSLRQIPIVKQFGESMKVIYILPIFFFFLITGCAATPRPPVIMVANVQWQQQPVGKPLVWREFNRSGIVRGSPDVNSLEYRDYMNVDEAKISENQIARLWQYAEKAVIENAKVWSDPAPWPGEGHEQIIISFCDYFLGWQTLSLVWKADDKPKGSNTLSLIKQLEDNPMGEPAVKTADLLQFKASDL